MRHGFNKTDGVVIIWAQEKGASHSWSEPFFKGRGSWGRTPGRAARAFARRLSGLQRPDTDGYWWAQCPNGESFGYLTAADRAADRDGSRPWLAKVRRLK
jgi:hypothetical protein